MADIILEDENDILECGIEINARPPGKELRSISLMSGGERTLTAIALLLAIFRSKPSPFCVLDEVDAALDEANNTRLASVLQEFREQSQFIVGDAQETHDGDCGFAVRHHDARIGRVETGVGEIRGLAG